MSDIIQIVVTVILSLTPLFIAIFVGGAMERAHLRSLDEREKEFGFVELTALKRLPTGTQVQGSALCVGGVVVAPSYWKMLLTQWRAFFGGEMRSMQAELTRGRREALVRLKRNAASLGCDLIVNLRIETGRVGLMGGNKNSYPTVEILATGTGIRRAKATRPAIGQG